MLPMGLRQCLLNEFRNRAQFGWALGAAPSDDWNPTPPQLGSRIPAHFYTAPPQIKTKNAAEKQGRNPSAKSRPRFLIYNRKLIKQAENGVEICRRIPSLFSHRILGLDGGGALKSLGAGGGNWPRDGGARAALGMPIQTLAFEALAY